jgi:hypothetical protein
MAGNNATRQAWRRAFRIDRALIVRTVFGSVVALVVEFAFALTGYRGRYRLMAEPFQLGESAWLALKVAVLTLFVSVILFFIYRLLGGKEEFPRL